MDNSRKKPGWIFWALVVLAGVPMLYMASFGPYLAAQVRQMPPSITAGGVTDPRQGTNFSFYKPVPAILRRCPDWSVECYRRYLDFWAQVGFKLR